MIIFVFFSIVILIEPILRFDLPVPAPRIVGEIIPSLMKPNKKVEKLKLLCTSRGTEIKYIYVDEIAGSPGSKKGIREIRDPGSGED